MTFVFFALSIILYMLAPMAYSEEYCLWLNILFIINAIYAYRKDSDKEFIGFHTFFSVTFYFMTYVYPVFIHPVITNYFSYAIDDVVMTKATALANVAYSSYVCGYLRTNIKAKKISHQPIVPSSPFEVLSWFKGADYVITDTFHGTIFSIITRRPFVTLIRPSNRNKIGSLLAICWLSDRGVFSPDQLAMTFSSLIDSVSVDTILAANRQQTKEYFKIVL